MNTESLQDVGRGGGLTFDYTRLIVRPRGETLSRVSLGS